MFQTHKAIFQCNDGLGHPGQFVYIRDDREEQEYFGLCEVEVFAFRGESPERTRGFAGSWNRASSAVWCWDADSILDSPLVFHLLTPVLFSLVCYCNTVLASVYKM